MDNKETQTPAKSGAISRLEPPCYPTEGLRPHKKDGARRFLAGATALFWVMIGCISLSVDILRGGGASWSLIAIYLCAYALLQSELLIFCAVKCPIAAALGTFALVNAITVLLSAIYGSMRFYLVLALPISAIFTALWTVLYFSKKLSRLKLLNLIGIFFILSVPCAIGIDLLISSYVGVTRMSWSFVTMAFCLPSAGICFCLYFYFKSREAFFHR